MWSVFKVNTAGKLSKKTDKILGKDLQADVFHSELLDF